MTESASNTPIAAKILSLSRLNLADTPPSTEYFREVRRVLRDDGTLWLNIADSGKGLWSKLVAEQPPSKQAYLQESGSIPSDMPVMWDGIKPKDMIGIP